MNKKIGSIVIAEDIKYQSMVKDKLLEREKQLRPLFNRPAYQGTELEKCSSSFLEDLKSRDID